MTNGYTSFASSAGVERRMRTLSRGRDTGPELALRRSLHAVGLRYRLHQAIVPGTRRRVDVVFGPSRVALFIDGCFWHGCPDHGKRTHAVNGWYWRPKIERNITRDRDTDRRLTEAGWLVLRVWEHEDVHAAARQVEAVVRQRRPGTPN